MAKRKVVGFLPGCGLMDRVPDEFWTHRRAARRERLLSWRSLVDAAIQRMEEQPGAGGKTAKAGLVPRDFWTHRKAARREDLLAMRSLLDGVLGWLESSPPPDTVARVEIE